MARFELHSINGSGPWSLSLDVYKELVRRNQREDFYFDDGLKSAYELGAPVLDDYRMQGTFAIISSFVGREGYMSWDDLRDLHERGHRIANHTHDHLNLSAIWFKEVIRDQIERCDIAIAENIPTADRILFVPPYNAINERVESIVDEFGLEIVKDRIQTNVQFR